MNLEWGRREEGRGMQTKRKIKVEFIHNERLNNCMLVEIISKKIIENGFDNHKEK